MAGRIIDTSIHWTNGAALRSWELDCAGCGEETNGVGTTSSARVALRARGWRYVKRYVDEDCVEYIRGWVCPACLRSNPELARKAI